MILFLQKFQIKSKNKLLKKFSIEVFSSKIELSPIILNGKDNSNKSITHLTKFSPIIESLETNNLKKDFQNSDWNIFFEKTNFKDYDKFNSCLNENVNKNDDDKNRKKKIKIISLFVKSDNNIKKEIFSIYNSTEKKNNFTNRKNKNYLFSENNSKCSCSKIGCDKNYCQCFSSGNFCYECNCTNCTNKYLNYNNFDRSIYHKNSNKILRRIKKKIIIECICTKTNCNKKYCECFRKGLKCNSKCKCINCQNCENKFDNLCENRCIFFSIINNHIINQKENDCFFIYNNEQKFFIGNKRKKKL